MFELIIQISFNILKQCFCHTCQDLSRCFGNAGTILGNFA